MCEAEAVSVSVIEVTTGCAFCGEADDVVVGGENEGVEVDEAGVVTRQTDERLYLIPGVHCCRPVVRTEAVFIFEDNHSWGVVGPGGIRNDINAVG